MILNAAENCFRRRGHYRTSIQDICLEAAITKATFYKHFATKEDCINAYFDRQCQVNVGLMALVLGRSAADADPVEEVLDAVVTLLKNDGAFERGRQNIEWWAESTRSDEVYQGFMSTFGAWRELLNVAIQRSVGMPLGARADGISTAMVAAVNGLILHATLERDRLDLDSLSFVMKAAWHGIVEELKQRHCQEAIAW